MERDTNEKLDSLLSEIAKVSLVVAETSKEVHSVNNRLTGLETVLNGINGRGGIVEDIKNMGEKLHKHGNSLNEFQRDLSVLDNDHRNLKKDVEEHESKIDKLEVSSATVNTKLAGVAALVSAIVTSLIGFAFKYLESK